MTLIDWAERLVSDTPLESTARWAWSRARAIGKPRKQQSLRYDAQAVQVMRRVLHETANCVDVGAHKGEFLRTMLSLAPRGTHFAFEPLPDLASDLARRFPRATVRNVAVSDTPGKREFLRVVDDPGLSGFRRMANVSPNARTTRISVPVMRLDDAVPKDLRISFVKIDVEGAQHEVLRGAAEMVRRDRPHIIFEHGALALESYGTSSDMMYDLLVEECGLQLSLMEDWLDGRPSLTRQQFVGHVGFHPTSHFCFLAHPAPTE